MSRCFSSSHQAPYISIRETICNSLCSKREREFIAAALFCHLHVSCCHTLLCNSVCFRRCIYVFLLNENPLWDTFLRYDQTKTFINARSIELVAVCYGGREEFSYERSIKKIIHAGLSFVPSWGSTTNQTKTT